jgi:hypothetical protein
LDFFCKFYLFIMRDAFFGPLRPCYRLLGVTHAPGQESLALVLRLLWSAVCILQGMGFIWAFGHTAHRVVRRTGDANIIAVLDSCEIGDAAVKKFRSVHVPIVFAIGVTLVILIFVLNLVTDILAGFENSYHVALSVGYLPAGFALVWPSMLVLLHFRALLLAARTVRADLLRCARGGNAARRTQDSADKFGPSSSSSSFALASSPETGDPAAAAAASVVRQRHTLLPGSTDLEGGDANGGKNGGDAATPIVAVGRESDLASAAVPTTLLRTPGSSKLGSGLYDVPAGFDASMASDVDLRACMVRFIHMRGLLHTTSQRMQWHLIIWNLSFSLGSISFAVLSVLSRTKALRGIVGEFSNVYIGWSIALTLLTLWFLSEAAKVTHAFRAVLETFSRDPTLLWHLTSKQSVARPALNACIDTHDLSDAFRLMGVKLTWGTFIQVGYISFSLFIVLFSFSGTIAGES